ncbi:Bug family tripartite tricarboxylate transporter substrate binding protein [Achromobacter insolitus]|uniref:Bug family tripartite tricarboxylate transporter substrate binding protein n=1 Tax=Achromobacter insolitus TaxID=217204 RepID=UPI001749F212|nr:tripartite tricarboxylate transporter substrate binding protein [Achromobacter insolitus]
MQGSFLARVCRVAGVACALLASMAAVAADYPARPIKLVVPQAAGGGTDVIGRLWADYLSRQLKTPVVVENRPGANGILASSYVAKQPADGYTVLVSGISYLAFNPHMYKDLPYEPARDFDGISLLVNTPFLLVAGTQTGIRSLDELVQQAKANPGALNFASAGKGNSTHLVVEMLAKRLGMALTHVPYNGAAAGLTSVMANQTQLMADVLNTGAVQAMAGKVVPLAVVGAKRAASVPDVPTLGELGLADFPLPGWYALVAPKGTPAPAIDRLNAETRRFFDDPAVKARLQELQLEPLPSAPETVAQWTQRDSATWGPLIRQLGLSND